MEARNGGMQLQRSCPWYNNPRINNGTANTSGGAANTKKGRGPEQSRNPPPAGAAQQQRTPPSQAKTVSPAPKKRSVSAAAPRVQLNPAFLGVSSSVAVDDSEFAEMDF